MKRSTERNCPPDKARLPYRMVAIGVSTGGMEALSVVLGRLPADFPLPVVVVQHQGLDGGGFLAKFLGKNCQLKVKEAEDKEPAEPGTVYLAPANYHLLLDDDLSFSLSLEGPVRFSRPSIDLLFTSAADACGRELIAIILTGANEDGSKGLAAVKENGGLALVQDPATAEAAMMPQSAIRRVDVDFVLPLKAIGAFLSNLYRK